ncbi:MAG: hypothetical protein QM714_03435 [Nocardioides sp.]|uniref:DUF6907 domain-containing protein n=1 Tax=Nocardioides sp. TaxID=35761 RepID=UPI0039E5906F
MDSRHSGQHDPQSAWPPEHCPPWCARPHSRDDHPEDRLHRSEAVIFPVVTTGDFLSIDRHTGEAQVFITQGVRGDVWVSVLDSDTPAVQLNLTLDSAIGLETALRQSLALAATA